MKKFIRRRLLLTAVVLTVILAGFFCYHCYWTDRYDIIKPLPAEIPIIIRMDAYGDGRFGAPRRGYKHRGIDLLAEVGTPVLACKSGRVLKTPYDKLSGNHIVIGHKDGLSSYYLHLKEVYAEKDKRVRQGQVIGSVGKSGNANHRGIKPHLHFEIRKDNAPQDILKIYELKSFDRRLIKR